MPRRFGSQECLASARERKTELMGLSANPDLTNHERRAIWDAERLDDMIWNFRRGLDPGLGDQVPEAEAILLEEIKGLISALKPAS